MVSDPVMVIRKLDTKLMDLNMNTMMNSTGFYTVILVYADTDRLPLNYQGKMKQKTTNNHRLRTGGIVNMQAFKRKKTLSAIILRVKTN